MKIALGCDHGGYAMKEDIKKQLEGLGHEVKDCGTYSTESCDYPIFGEAAARAVASGECEYGIVVCTTGIGISIAANKVKGIRCAHCADTLEAQLCRQHNNANMMAIGAGFTGPKLAAAMVETFLSTAFEGGRHARRVARWTLSRAKAYKSGKSTKTERFLLIFLLSKGKLLHEKKEADADNGKKNERNEGLYRLSRAQARQRRAGRGAGGHFAVGVRLFVCAALYGIRCGRLGPL